MKFAVAPCLCSVLFLFMADGLFAEVIVRSAAQLRALPIAEAKKGLPVEMDVVATFVDRARGMLFVHDGQQGFFVWAYDLMPRSDWVRVGGKIRLKGVTQEGGFLPEVKATDWIDLGPGVLPQALMPTSLEALLLPSKDSQWVSAEGVVKRLAVENDGVVLCIQEGEVRVPIELPHFAKSMKRPELPMNLLEKRVRIQAVAATLFNEQRQMSGRLLYMPSFEFLTLLEADSPSEQVPLRRVDELMLGHSPLNERVRVRGVVTHALPDEMLFIRGEGGSMRIESALTPHLKPGSLIEAEGNVTFFPFRPGLDTASFNVLSGSESLKPLPLDLAAERRSAEQFELVTLDTTYLDMMKSSISPRLLCRSGDVVFEVKLPVNLKEELNLESGMCLRLSGICELELDNAFGIARYTKVFTISLRSATDLVVLQRPTYWNNQRLVLLLSITVALGLLIAFWAWMLRRKVAQQSVIIEQQTEMRATLGERQRIARELHDTLEQELSGVAMLLDAATEQFQSGEGEPMGSLALAQQLLRHSREESRTMIRDLRSVAIEKLGLAGAIESLLRPLAEAGGMAFEFACSGPVVKQSGAVESAFLRVAHEAVANAAKHSRASHVRVQLMYESDFVKLEVTDDGKGFSPETVGDDSTGHFGISGMRERAERIQAVLEVDGQSGSGTRVSLSWRVG